MKLADLFDRLRRWANRVPVSPDGFYYLQAARGEPVPRPYAYRWFLPWLCGPEPARFVLATYASLAALPVVAWLFFGTFDVTPIERGFAVALLCLLQGVTRTSIRYPVLTDAPAFVLALASAWAVRAGFWGSLPAGVVLALLAGATREQAPIFAALWAWSPWPLLGLAGVGLWRPFVAPKWTESAKGGLFGAYRTIATEPLAPWLEHPIRAALAKRWQLGLDGALYVRPWGAAVMGLLVPSWQLFATLAVAYLQLVAAQDSVRLYQWAAPVLVAHAAVAIPVSDWPPWGLVALALTITRDDRV